MNRIQNIIRKRLKIRVTSFWPAITALIIATILFCLPGEEFPKPSWLDNLHIDKFVHIGLFSVLVFLWILPPRARSDKQKVNQMYLWITLAFFAYGIGIEFIQLNFIPHRSFDVLDVVADGIGCAFGVIAASKTPEP
jgi:hypothetical protein